MTSKKRKLRSDNISRYIIYRGVTESGERFKAQIYVNKKQFLVYMIQTYLGMYDTPKEAAVAYELHMIVLSSMYQKIN